MLEYTKRDFLRLMQSEKRDTITSIENTYIRWYDDLQNLYISLFDYSGMPLQIPIERVEQWLLYKGSVCFFIDEIIGPLILPFVTQGQLDPYGLPYRIRAYSVTGYQIELLPDQYVIIWDNRLHISGLAHLQQYATRLAELDKTIDINLLGQRTPTLLTAESEGQLVSLKDGYAKLRSGMPVMAQIGTAVSNGISALSVGAPPVFPELIQAKQNLLNEALSYIGVPNTGRPKSERMIASEMAAINGHVSHERTSRLETRQKACDEINSKFGKFLAAPVTVDFAHVDYNYGIGDNMIGTPASGGGADGELYT